MAPLTVYDDTSTPGRPLDMLMMACELEELGDPLAGGTPALSCTRSKTLRVSNGTRSMVAESINWPTVELLVSTSAGAVDTVTISFMLPTFREIFAVETWSTVTNTLS